MNFEPNRIYFVNIGNDSMTSHNSSTSHISPTSSIIKEIIDKLNVLSDDIIKIDKILPFYKKNKENKEKELKETITDLLNNSFYIYFDNSVFINNEGIKKAFNNIIVSVILDFELKNLINDVNNRKIILLNLLKCLYIFLKLIQKKKNIGNNLAISDIFEIFNSTFKNFCNKLLSTINNFIIIRYYKNINTRFDNEKNNEINFNIISILLLNYIFIITNYQDLINLHNEIFNKQIDNIENTYKFTIDEKDKLYNLFFNEKDYQIRKTHLFLNLTEINNKYNQFIKNIIEIQNLLHLIYDINAFYKFFEKYIFNHKSNVINFFSYYIIKKNN